MLHEADIGFFFGPVGHPALAVEMVGQASIACVALLELAKVPVIGLDGTHPLGMTVAQPAAMPAWALPPAGAAVHELR